MPKRASVKPPRRRKTEKQLALRAETIASLKKELAKAKRENSRLIKQRERDAEMNFKRAYRAKKPRKRVSASKRLDRTLGATIQNVEDIERDTRTGKARVIGAGKKHRDAARALGYATTSKGIKVNVYDGGRVTRDARDVRGFYIQYPAYAEINLRGRNPSESIEHYTYFVEGVRRTFKRRGWTVRYGLKFEDQESFDAGNIIRFADDRIELLNLIGGYIESEISSDEYEPTDLSGAFIVLEKN